MLHIGLLAQGAGRQQREARLEKIPFWNRHIRERLDLNLCGTYRMFLCIWKGKIVKENTNNIQHIALQGEKSALLLLCLQLTLTSDPWKYLNDPLKDQRTIKHVTMSGALPAKLIRPMDVGSITLYTLWNLILLGQWLVRLLVGRPHDITPPHSRLSVQPNYKK